MYIVQSFLSSDTLITLSLRFCCYCCSCCFYMLNNEEYSNMCKRALFYHHYELLEKKNLFIHYPTLPSDFSHQFPSLDTMVQYLEGWPPLTRPWHCNTPKEMHFTGKWNGSRLQFGVVSASPSTHIWSAKYMATLSPNEYGNFKNITLRFIRNLLWTCYLFTIAEKYAFFPQHRSSIMVMHLGSIWSRYQTGLSSRGICQSLYELHCHLFSYLL